MRFTRRRFMTAAAALGLSAYGSGVAQERSPARLGRYRVERALLGAASGTTRLPVPDEVPSFNGWVYTNVRLEVIP